MKSIEITREKYRSIKKMNKEQIQSELGKAYNQGLMVGSQRGLQMGLSKTIEIVSKGIKNCKSVSNHHDEIMACINAQLMAEAEDESNGKEEKE